MAGSQPLQLPTCLKQASAVESYGKTCSECSHRPHPVSSKLAGTPLRSTETRQQLTGRMTQSGTVNLPRTPGGRDWNPSTVKASPDYA